MSFIFRVTCKLWNSILLLFSGRGKLLPPFKKTKKFNFNYLLCTLFSLPIILGTCIRPKSVCHRILYYSLHLGVSHVRRCSGTKVQADWRRRRNWQVLPPIKALISVSKCNNSSQQLGDVVLATMQGHVLTRVQTDFDFLIDQRVVVLHALGFWGR